MNMFRTMFAAIILMGHEPNATCYTTEDVKALKQKLFVTNGYDCRIRPAYNQSKKTGIYSYLYLLAINELNEAKQTMKSSAFLSLNWRDSFLRWNQTDHNGIEDAYWPQNEVWKPDIALKNSNLEHKELGVPSLYVVNSYVGTVRWEPFQVFESTCSMDITNFPFDTQTCYLQFKSVYPLREVEMICGFTLLATQYYKPNAGWDLTDVSCEMQGDWSSTISFSLTIRRKPLFIMMSVIFPMLVLSILNICVFVLPNDSGEKASFSISVFLAFAVFLTIFSASLPQNSNSVALIGVFLIIQTTCSTMTTVFALALLRMSSFNENVAIPQIMMFFMRCLKCKSRSNASLVVPTDNGATDGRMSDESSTGDVGYKSCAESSRYVPTEIRATESRMSNTASTGDVEYSWKEVVNFLDVVLFVTFTCILIASSLWCYLSAINYKRSEY